MQKTLLRSALDCGAATPPDVRLVVAYDDFANKMCALRLLEGLAKDLGKSFCIAPCYVKFEQLLDPETARRTAAEADTADMVVVVTCEGAELPPPVKRWMSRWKRRVAATARPGALVVVLNSVQGARSVRTPIQSHLSRFAKTHGMRYICQHIQWARDDTAFVVPIKQQAGLPPAPLAPGFLGSILRPKAQFSTAI